MPNVRLKNVNPLGDVWLPALGKDIRAGEVFGCPKDLADNLLMQVGNYELVETDQAKPAADVKKSTALAVDGQEK